MLRISKGFIFICMSGLLASVGAFSQEISDSDEACCVVAADSTDDIVADSETPKLHNFTGVNELKEVFNADAGKRRLLLLLSPT